MAKRSYAFVFPLMPGDLNPSLPIARKLVQQGHSVHYLCFRQFREAIEDTGAVFHDAVDIESELYTGRVPGPFGAMQSLGPEFGCDGDGEYLVRIKLYNVQIELQLPGLLRFLNEVAANVVIYDPVVCPEAAIAATITKVPCAALLAFAGPGAWEETVRLKVENERATFQQFDEHAKSFPDNLEALSRMQEQYGLERKAGFNFGALDPIPRLTLVTTLADLKAPETAALQARHRSTNAEFVYLGPLLDVDGAKRAGGFKVGVSQKAEEDVTGHLEDAQAKGRPIVVVSMGTVTTGDHPTLGWNGRQTDADGTKIGLSGKQLFQSAVAGVCRACGRSSNDVADPLILISQGPQPDALAGIDVPANVVARTFLPQVDVLRARPICFVTHGGQNSFMESLANAVPMVGDQFDNARKAEEMGVGQFVPRPQPPIGGEDVAAADYADAVCAAVTAVTTGDVYTTAALNKAKMFSEAGGVQKGVDILNTLGEAAASE